MTLSRPAALVAVAVSLALVTPSLLRGDEAPDLLSVEAPDEALKGVLRSLATEPQVTSEAVASLLDRLRVNGEPLLDLEPDLEWIEAWQLADLVLDDLSALGEPSELLAELLGAPELLSRSLELEEETGGAFLARAGGVLSMRTLPCSVEQVEGLVGRPTEADAAVIEAEGEVAGAWMRWPARRVTRGVLVDHAGLTSATRVSFEGAAASAWADGGDVRLLQRWVLELWVEQTATTSVRFVAAWTEAAGDEVDSGSRLWTAWELARAWDEGDRWAAACRSGDPGALQPVPGDTRPDPRSQGPSGAASGSTSAVSAELPGWAGSLRGVCEGARLVQIEGHFRELHMLSANTSDSIDGPGDPDGERGRAERSWSSELRRGVVRWARVLGESPAGLSDRHRARLERLVGAFGSTPELFPAGAQARVRSRWRRGLLDEALDQDPIRVPVCPSALDYTALQLGWSSAEERATHRDDIELVAAAAILESGSPRQLTEEQWAATREALAFGEALLRLFGSPDPSLGVLPGAADPETGTSEIDRVDSNL